MQINKNTTLGELQEMCRNTTDCRTCNYSKNCCDVEPCNFKFNEPNKYWDNITEIYNKQRNKGVATYGQTLEQNTKPNINERINYIQEELVDALMYLEWLKDSMKGDLDE